MGVKSKYKPRYSKALQEGLRKDGLIIEECCLLWGITTPTWYNWIATIPKFAEAAAIAEMDYRAYFAKKFREKMNGTNKTPGNAGMLIFAAKNVMGWADKVETHTTHDDEVKIIKIEMLPSNHEIKQIENIIDVVSEDV